MVISGSVVTLSIRLEAATRQEGKVWLAWCPPLDVTTQADTKQRALASLKQAVELWFESCIARNVLEEALLEAGFCKMKSGESSHHHMLSRQRATIKKCPSPHILPHNATWTNLRASS